MPLAVKSKPPPQKYVFKIPITLVDPIIFTQLCETLAILKDEEFMQAIKIGVSDVAKGRVHNFSELLAEYGLD